MQNHNINEVLLGGKLTDSSQLPGEGSDCYSMGPEDYGHATNYGNKKVIFPFSNVFYSQKSSTPIPSKLLCLPLPQTTDFMGKEERVDFPNVFKLLQDHHPQPVTPSDLRKEAVNRIHQYLEIPAPEISDSRNSQKVCPASEASEDHPVVVDEIEKSNDPIHVFCTEGASVLSTSQRQHYCVGTRCQHVECWKRLRAKKGHIYYVCTQCSSKWRIPTRNALMGKILQAYYMRELNNLE